MNPRFIEGNITTPTISGVTFSYSKWSLSGTQLMIVISGTTTAKINAEALAVTVELPQWVKDKISPINVNHTYLVSISFGSARAIGVGYETPKFIMNKQTGVITIKNDEALNSSNAAAYVFRVQFDLLIDTN